MRTIMSAEYVKSLNDLQLTVVINNTGSEEARNEFHRRYDKTILKVARGACYSINYDAGLSYDELQSDVVSEAFLAADYAVRLYNGASSLKSYLTDKIKKHLLDLKRKNSIHSSREYLDTPCDEDDEEYECSWGEYAEANERFKRDQSNVEALDQYAALLKLTTNARHKACLQHLLVAYQEDVKKPFEYVAHKLGCSRQQVYNILDSIRKNVAGKFAA